MTKAIWVVVIIIMIGLGVWYFASTGSKNTNANGNTNSNVNTNASANVNANANANSNTNTTTNNTPANANSTSQFQTNGNTNTQSESGPDYAVNIGEYSFTPAEIKVDLGDTVTVKVTNSGSTSHNFVIAGLNVNSGLLSPGQSKTLTITAPSTAGTYDFDCTVSGHKDLGMTGTLKVVQL